MTKVEAAQQVLGQGGIPNAAVTSGGTVRYIRMEHIWVEAWIDYLPSRGAQHIEGDTWIPVDASFKQYTYSKPLPLESLVPISLDEIKGPVLEGSAFNTTEVWLQNANVANLDAAVKAYQSRIQTHIAQRPSTTLADFFGEQRIIVKEVDLLAGTLALRIIAKGPQFASLPTALRHKFQYALYASEYERTIDSPIWVVEQSLPRLAGKKITLSSKAATPEDAQLVASYLPRPHPDGRLITSADLPSTIAAYARVIPVLRVDSEIVATGYPMPIGAELAGRGAITHYDISGWDYTDDDTLVAGQVSAIGLSVQGISREQLERLRVRIEESHAKVVTRDTSLHRDNIGGDLLTAAAWRYFVSHQIHGAFLENHAGVVDRPGISYGLVNAVVQPNKLFGLITATVSFPGIGMDVGHVRSIRVAQAGNEGGAIRYNQIRGYLSSALEHSIPQATLSLDSEPAGHGTISSVKALELATLQGQKIYTVRQENIGSVLPQLQHSVAIIQDIENAVAAGKVVVITEGRVQSGSWTGAGFVVTDPGTGAGGFFIEGGARGGFDDNKDIDFMISVAAASGNDGGDPEGDKAILGIIMDILFGWLAPILSKVAPFIKEALTYLTNLTEIWAKCNTVQAAFLSYGLAVITFLVVVAPLLLFPTAILFSILLGAFLSAIISAIYTTTLVQVVCTLPPPPPRNS